MPDFEQAMKQGHGGDDIEDAPPPEEPKKPSLGKFNMASDANIRDVFWAIMQDYADGKKPDLSRYEEVKEALVRIGISVLKKPEMAYHGVSAEGTAYYTLQMTLDMGWEDMFVKVLEESAEQESSAELASEALTFAVKKNEEQIGRYFEGMLKRPESGAWVLHYLMRIGNKKLIEKLRKFIMVIAQTDVEESQLSAMHALALIGDSEIQTLLIRLLQHWDPATRRTAAVLLQKNPTKELVEIAERRLALENDERVKTELLKITGKNTKKGKK